MRRTPEQELAALRVRLAAAQVNFDASDLDGADWRSRAVKTDAYRFNFGKGYTPAQSAELEELGQAADLLWNKVIAAKAARRNT